MIDFRLTETDQKMLERTREEGRICRRYAREFDLEISVGSDFHRDAPYAPALGVDLPRADGLRGVWERWVA